jgi:CheY-like chemotaxis protein
MEPSWIESSHGTRFQRFQNLMRKRVTNILLVSSLYDFYIFEEDGRLYELIRNEYQGFNLSHAPELSRVSSGKEILKQLKEGKKFDLIITTLHIEDMHALELAKIIKSSEFEIPIILLAYDNRELRELIAKKDVSVFEKVYIWQGDYRLIVFIIKQLEDKINVESDTKIVGVQSIILIEDDVGYYSSFLPLIYSELLNQSQRLISEGINLSHKYLRMRARPKILLCTNYEEAWGYINKYQDDILGIISDIDFSYKGKDDPEAGIRFVENVNSQNLDIPILLQSSSPENEKKANELGVSFLLKNSPTLLHDLRQFMINNFSFGDFKFKTQDGNQVGRASNLKSLEEVLKTVPANSIRYHAERNHFSNWLKARTEFDLADKLRPRKVSEYPSLDALRDYLISSLREYRINRQRGLITDFNKSTFEPSSSFARIGGGSLGGKTRGLGFVNILINNYNLSDTFKGINISVPPAVALGTDIFDQFLDENNLRSFALNCNDDLDITEKFVQAEYFPEEAVQQLEDFTDIMRMPLAVRSSSLLEDSQYHPFAGVYKTYMIPNNNKNPKVRLNDLIEKIKKVYASTFHKGAKDYIKMTSYRLEEEKMAVIVMKITGSEKGNRFYPDFAGVAKSYNYYPAGPQDPGDGIVSVALGLGKMVADGGQTVKFSPKYPNHIPQFSSIENTLKNNQNDFFALDLEDNDQDIFQINDSSVKKYSLFDAEKDGSLRNLASTYSIENHAIYDGVSRDGTRLITFSPILKNKIFPLPQITDLLLEMGNWGMGLPIEIEFAVNMSVPKDEPKIFSILQMRPLVYYREIDELTVNETDDTILISKSQNVLGNGIIDNIYDIVYVDMEVFNRNKSREVAQEVSSLNSKLIEQKRPYLLIGVGRWGSLDPWLGIPVTWEQICGAGTIIETGFKDFVVTPSQGSHFFQNITSFMIGYFTIGSKNKNDFIDWKWIMDQKPLESFNYIKHLQFNNPIVIRMNGRKNTGIILKPEN